MNCGHKFSFSVIKLLQTSNKLQPHIPLNYKLLVLKYINIDRVKKLKEAALWTMREHTRTFGDFVN